MKTKKRKKPWWSGWSGRAPTRRKKMMKRCGKKCFLGPNLSFPICAKGTCRKNKRGIMSAYIRAKQWGKPRSFYKNHRGKPKMKRKVYTRVAKKARKLMGWKKGGRRRRTRKKCGKGPQQRAAAEKFVGNILSKYKPKAKPKTRRKKPHTAKKAAVTCAFAAKLNRQLARRRTNEAAAAAGSARLVRRLAPPVVGDVVEVQDYFLSQSPTFHGDALASYYGGYRGFTDRGPEWFLARLTGDAAQYRNSGWRERYQIQLLNAAGENAGQRLQYVESIKFPPGDEGRTYTVGQRGGGGVSSKGFCMGENNQDTKYRPVTQLLPAEHLGKNDPNNIGRVTPPPDITSQYTKYIVKRLKKKGKVNKNEEEKIRKFMSKILNNLSDDDWRDFVGLDIQQQHTKLIKLWNENLAEFGNS